MGLKDFFARQRQKANDKEVLNASIAEHDESIVEDAPAPKKRKSRKSAEPSSPEMTKEDVTSSTKKSSKNAKTADKTIDDADEKSTKKTRRYRAKTKVVAQANDDDTSAQNDESKTHSKKKDAQSEHSDDATDWKNRKKKNQPPAKKYRPPISMKQFLLSSLFIYSVLILIILVQSFWVVRQSFMYRAEYQQLNQLNEKERQLNIEWGRMLIEKQTFGSSAQIATRATMEMGMFSPSREQRIIITLPENKPSSSPSP